MHFFKTFLIIQSKAYQRKCWFNKISPLLLRLDQYLCSFMPIALKMDPKFRLDIGNKNMTLFWVVHPHNSILNLRSPLPPYPPYPLSLRNHTKPQFVRYLRKRVFPLLPAGDFHTYPSTHTSNRSQFVAFCIFSSLFFSKDFFSLLPCFINQFT